MKRKQKTITKRQLVKMLKRMDACWGARELKGSIQYIFNFARRNGGLQFLNRELGMSDECFCICCVNGWSESKFDQLFDELNRAALAYCRKHKIK